MDKHSRDEFTSLYPDRSKTLLDCIDRALLDLKEKDKSVTELAELRGALEILKNRCMILNFKNHTMLLQKMIEIFTQLEGEAFFHHDAAIDILMESFEHLKKYFLEDESAAEKETERLAYKIRLLQSAKEQNSIPLQ